METYCSLCTVLVDTIHRLFFLNKINKVQWVDFKLENVLVSLHSLKTMGLAPLPSPGVTAPLFLRNGVTRTFSYSYRENLRMCVHKKIKI